MDQIIPGMNDIINYLETKANNFVDPDLTTLMNKIQDLKNFRDSDLDPHVQNVNDIFPDLKDQFLMYMGTVQSSNKTSTFGLIVGELGILEMKENTYNNTVNSYRDHILSTLCDPNFNSTFSSLSNYIDKVSDFFGHVKDSSASMINDVLSKTIGELTNHLGNFSKKIISYMHLDSLSKNIDLDTIECLTKLAMVNTPLGNAVHDIINGNISGSSEIINQFKDEMTAYKEAKKDDILYGYIDDYRQKIEDIYNFHITNSPACADTSILQDTIQDIISMIEDLEKCFKRLPK